MVSVLCTPKALISSVARGLVTRAAEGYGATLDKIERELVDMNKKFNVGVTLPPARASPFS